MIEHCVWIIRGWLHPNRWEDVPPSVQAWIVPVDKLMRNPDGVVR